MRRGVAEAVHHARHRSAFGAPLAEQPLMVNVLADLAVESEAATATALRLARAYDEDGPAAAALRHRGDEVLDLQARDAARGRGARVPGRQRLRRGVADAAAAARRAAQRHLGGLGQRDLARRPARARPRARGPARLPGRVRARRAAPTAGSTRTSTRCRGRWPSSAADDAQWLARRAVEDLALAFQGSLLVRHAPPAVADAFCAGRLGDGARPRVRDAAARDRRRRDRRPRAGHLIFFTSGGSRAARGRVLACGTPSPSTHGGVGACTVSRQGSGPACCVLGLVGAGTAGAARLITGARGQERHPHGRRHQAGLASSASDLSATAPEQSLRGGRTAGRPVPPVPPGPEGPRGQRRPLRRAQRGRVRSRVAVKRHRRRRRSTIRRAPGIYCLTFGTGDSRPKAGAASGAESATSFATLQIDPRGGFPDCPAAGRRCGSSTFDLSLADARRRTASA